MGENDKVVPIRHAPSFRLRERERFWRATKIQLAEYKGRFMFLAVGVDRIYTDTEHVGDVLRLLAADGYPVPAYAWACKPDSLRFDLLKHVEERFSRLPGYDPRNLDTRLVSAAQEIIDHALDHVFGCDESTAVLLPAVT